jgi:cadmium resistance protein CadD (predicted permease)
MDWLPLIALSVTAFVATNLDDAFLLLLFFGDRRYRARHVFIGQALGVGLLVLLSLIGARAALALPARAVGLLGLLPIAIGVKQLLERRRARQAEPEAVVAPPGAAGWRRAAAVAGVTLANGGDNVGVYIPLFATRAYWKRRSWALSMMLVVWTLPATTWRGTRPFAQLQRLSGVVMPWVIGLGVVIIVESNLP